MGVNSWYVMHLFEVTYGMSNVGKKHDILKYTKSLKIKKEIVSIWEGSSSEWRKYTSTTAVSNESKVGVKDCGEFRPKLSSLRSSCS